MPSFGDAFKDQAKVAENQIKGAAAGFSSVIVDSAYQTGNNILNLTAYLSTVASKVVSRPIESASGAVEAGNTWINSSLQELVTGVPTNPMWYIKQGISFFDKNTDSTGRLKPYPNTKVSQSNYNEKYNAFTGQLIKPVNNIIESGKDLVRRYDITGKLFSSYNSDVDIGNEYKSISYIIKPTTYAELQKNNVFSILNNTSSDAKIESKSTTGDVDIFDVMEYGIRVGGGYYSCTITQPKNSLAPRFYHFSSKKFYPETSISYKYKNYITGKIETVQKAIKDPSNALTWLPLTKEPSFSLRDISTKDSISTMSNSLFYSMQMKKVERIEINLAENMNLDIINYLERYRKVMFPEDNTYITSPIKDVASIFTYYVYSPLVPNDNASGSIKKLIRQLQFLVVPEFNERYDDSSGAKSVDISFIVIGEN